MSKEYGNATWGGIWRPANTVITRAFFGAIAVYLTLRRWNNRHRKHRSTALGYSCAATERMAIFLENGLSKLNIGGGSKNLQGFVNIDFVRHPSAEREVVANILDLTFVPSRSISHIHANHVIEHLSPDEWLSQLSQWRRILKPEGLVTIRCPSALGAAYSFWFPPILEAGREEFVRYGFPCDEEFGNPADGWGHRDVFATLHWFFGDVGNPVNQHLNLITPGKLVADLQAGGFHVLGVSAPEALNVVVVARLESK